MEAKVPEASSASGEIFVPKIENRPRFSASKREIAAAFAMYLTAWLYTNCLLPIGGDGMERFWMAAFTLGFVATAEWLCRGIPRSGESWVWLGCVAALTASLILPLEMEIGGTVLRRLAVWGKESWFNLHIFAVWWALNRSGRLAEGRSGRLLPYDALNAFLLFPFSHFFLRIRSVFFGLRSLCPKERKQVMLETVGASALAAALALVLLALALRLLGMADEGFAALLQAALSLFRLDFRWDSESFAALTRLLLSLPVGAYLFGMLAGSVREDPERLRERGAALCRGLESLRKVPARSWLLLTGLFCAVYAVFFVLQGSYLFGAFFRKLPEGFIVSEYARRGFFELCRVMAINFLLLWLVTRSAREQGRGLRALCIVLLAESFLFSVVAMSKLLLYIDCFGFTPLRLQSCWLICVLAFGCVCATVSLLTGRRSFRTWMMFGAVSLSLLALL